MVIVFTLLDFLFMFLSIEYYMKKQWFWAWVFTLVGMTTWFFLAASTLEIEQPFQIYNASSGMIETGIHTITSKTSPEQLYFYMMLGVVMFLFFTLQTFVQAGLLFKKRRNKRLGLDDGEG
jgi:hypothetical protein